MVSIIGLLLGILVGNHYIMNFLAISIFDNFIYPLPLISSVLVIQLSTRSDLFEEVYQPFNISTFIFLSNYF